MNKRQKSKFIANEEYNCEMFSEIQLYMYITTATVHNLINDINMLQMDNIQT